MTSPSLAIPPPLTSYARNFEDVLLWRALREVGAGFYIDVGAEGLVGEAFRERGWQGIHIVAEEGDPRTVRLDALFDKAGGRDIHWLRIGPGQDAGSWGDSSVRPWVVLARSADWDPFLLGKGYRPAHFDGVNRFYLSEAHAELEARFTGGPNGLDDFVLAETSDFARPLAAELDDLRGKLADKTLFCDALEAGRAEDRLYIGHLEEALVRFKRDLSEVRQTAHLQQEAIDRERDDFIRHQTELQRRHEELQRHAAAVAARLASIESSRSWRWTGVIRRAVRLLKGRP